jgi:hypothetical protein
VNRNPFNRFGRVHGKHSWFDYTAHTPSDRLRIRATVGTACDAVLRGHPSRVTGVSLLCGGPSPELLEGWLATRSPLMVQASEGWLYQQSTFAAQT